VHGVQRRAEGVLAARAGLDKIARLHESEEGGEEDRELRRPGGVIFARSLICQFISVTKFIAIFLIIYKLY
jgi:hypothetical protein